MKHTIDVKTGNGKYCIHIGRSISSALKEHLDKMYVGKKRAVISDLNVEELHRSWIESLDPDIVLAIEPGERSKCREEKALLEDTLLTHGFGRDSLIIAIGGGVVGDLAGFVASTYMRGIPVIQVPTTVLSMVDSSVGGKTAINTDQGKNMIGSFWQPDAVFMDLDFLKTLPDEEMKNGLIEALKMGAILDEDLFHMIETSDEPDYPDIKKIIIQSVTLKKQVVEEDEKDLGRRNILNFGHTIGHALEIASGGSLKHGFCVGIGMCIESRIALIKGICDKKSVSRIEKIISSLSIGLKVKETYPAKALFDLMKTDKKSERNIPKIITLEKIGKVSESKTSIDIDLKLLEEAMSDD